MKDTNKEKKKEVIQILQKMMPMIDQCHGKRRKKIPPSGYATNEYMYFDKISALIGI